MWGPRAVGLVLGGKGKRGKKRKGRRWNGFCPPEITVGLWVGTQATKCPPSQAAPRDLVRCLACASLGLSCPSSTRKQDGTCSLLALSDTAGMVFSCQLLLVFFPDSCWNQLPKTQHQPLAHSCCSCLAGLATAEYPWAGRRGSECLARCAHRLFVASHKLPLIPPPPPAFSAVNSPFPFQNSSGTSGLCFSSTCSYLPPISPRQL